MADPSVLKKLDRIADILREQIDLLRRLVDAAQTKPTPVVSAAELDEEAPTDLVGTVYRLDVPKEPPVGTVELVVPTP